jgi:ABC-type multidrug transport system fused ATPase/permease subunit
MRGLQAILRRLDLSTISNLISKILTFINRKDKKKLLLLSLGSIAVSLFDILALVILYGFASLATKSISGGGDPQIVILGTDVLVNGAFLATCGFLVILLFFLKSLFSALNTRSLYRFLGDQDTKIFREVFGSSLRAPVGFLGRYGHSNSVGITIQASDTFSIRILGSIILFISDAVLLIVLLITSAIIDPIPAFVSFSVLLLTVVLIDKYLKKRLQSLGKEQSDAFTNAIGGIDQALFGIKEFKIRGATEIALVGVEAHRQPGVRARAELAFLAQVPKYALELALIVASALTALIQFARLGGAAAAAGLLLLVALGFRMLPAIARMQGSIADLRSAIPITQQALAYLDSITMETEEFNRQVSSLGAERNSALISTSEFQLVASDISFTHVGSSEHALKGVNVCVPAKKMTAIVGPSGAGKTTLIDLICGFRLPDNGNIYQGSDSIFSNLEDWQKSIAFVSQDVYISNGSIAENVAFGEDEFEIDRARVSEVLGLAQLDQWVKSLEGGIDTHLQARGTSVSGGQRQRIGIARALYRKSKLIIFDEATSALDAVTEDEISQVLAALRTYSTVIAITHRLSTVKNADNLIYLSGGEVIGSGTFGELVKTIPDFARAAELSGLLDSQS